QQGSRIEVDSPEPTAMPATTFSAGVLDEDPSHGLGRRAEEVAPVVPGFRVTAFNQPQVGLVDQGRRLECLARSLPGEPGGRQLAQLAVDQRQKPVGGSGLALVDRLEDSRHFVHRIPKYAKFGGPARRQWPSGYSVRTVPSCYGPRDGKASLLV